MAKKYYNGHLLPDIEPLWNKTTYPYAYISICDAENTGLPVETGLTGRYAHLVLIDTAGYIRIGDSYNNAYVANAEITAAKTFVIALDDDSVESLSSLYQGINKETWLETTNYYQYEAAAGEGPHWTNTTLYDADGNLFLEASDPVTPFDLTAWLTGYALGLCGKPLPFSKAEKEPVAYLYNGVRLPKLPEWDRESYPYAHISKFTAIEDYVLVVHTKPLFVKSSGMVQVNEDITEGVPCMKWFSTEANRPWTESTSNVFRYDQADDIAWTNTDVPIQSTGEILLAATDPVPVYE